MMRSIISPRKYLRLVSAALLFVSLAAAGTARPALAQTTLVVDDDGRATAADCNANQRAHRGIQEAVDAAPPGSTIFVCPGTYVEQVVVAKSSLTIRGAGQGLTVLRPTALPADPGSVSPTPTPRRAVVLVNGAQAVTVTALTVDGSAADNGATNLFTCGEVGFTLGIYYRNSSGTVDSTQVTNIRSAARCSAGIFVESGSGAAASLVMTRSLIENYGMNGAVCNGQNTACTVTGNTLRGRGPVADQIQGGIIVRVGASSAITGNVIRDHVFTPRQGIGTAAAGVYLFGADPGSHPHLLQQNAFANNDVDVQRYATATTFLGP